MSLLRWHLWVVVTMLWWFISRKDSGHCKNSKILKRKLPRIRLMIARERTIHWAFKKEMHQEKPESTCSLMLRQERWCLNTVEYESQWMLPIRMESLCSYMNLECSSKNCERRNGNPRCISLLQEIYGLKCSSVSNIFSNGRSVLLWLIWMSFSNKAIKTISWIFSIKS